MRDGEIFNFTIVSKDVSFLSYLSKRFFAPSFRIHPLHETEDSFKEKIYRSIISQHENPKIQNLFVALFLGVPIKDELRVDITHWGVAHLVAISGFHLGVLMALGYAIFSPLYKWFQDRFFPYRNRKLDLGIFLLVLIFGYAWLIDFVPSFVRSFVMAVLVFIFLMRHIKLLSFGVLALCIVFLLAFSPSLALHLGFGFSVLGVFYIFLYLHHFKDAFKSKLLHAFLLNLWVFLAMVIPVHYWFDLNSLQQWGAVPLSLIFTLFYPLVAFLHLFGFGGVLDGILEAMLSFRLNDSGVFETTLWMLLGYLALSLLAIRYKWLAICLIFLGVLPFVVVQIST